MKSSSYLYGAAGVLAIVFIGYAATRSSAPSQLDGFAQCLSEKGMKVYAAWWCPHCARQKKMFGNAYDKLTSIECAAGLSAGQLGAVCTDKGITSVPLWELADGTRVPGVQELDKLAELSGCELPAQK